MELERMLLVPSKSRYELEIDRYGSEDTARHNFGSGEVWNTIMESHYAQKENIARIVEGTGVECLEDRSLLTDQKMADHDLFIIMGGDNHFTYCAEEVLRYQRDIQDPTDRAAHPKKVAGVVLDPNKSAGAILYFDTELFLESFLALQEDRLQTEQWTTLDVRVRNGENAIQPYPAMCDYFIGEYSRLLMSRNKVYVDGEPVFPDKSSGILIAAGAGSGPGSWYDNVNDVMFGDRDYLEKTDPAAKVVLTEHRSKSKLTLQAGQTLTIDSYNDDRGLITPDSHMDHSVDFMIGARAEVKVSDLKLNVIRPGYVQK